MKTLLKPYRNSIKTYLNLDKTYLKPQHNSIKIPMKPKYSQVSAPAARASPGKAPGRQEGHQPTMRGASGSTGCRTVRFALASRARRLLRGSEASGKHDHLGFDVWMVWAAFWAKVGPRIPLNGSGSENGAERTYKCARKPIMKPFRGQFLVQAKNSGRQGLRGPETAIRALMRSPLLQPF